MTEIRAYRPADRADVSEVCLKTGDAGTDATGLYSSDDLLSEIFVLPYVDLEPDFAFVVDSGDHVSGYTVGVPDTRAFVERFRREWLPGFGEKFDLVEPAVTREQKVVAMGFDPERMLIPELDEYPAHLHIDILDELQGQGFGRALMRTVLAALHAHGVSGAHLEFAEANTGARAFYKRLGFTPLPSSSNGTRVGIATDAVV